MKIKDSIYEEFYIEEPVLIELIEHPALQRLKTVGQLSPMVDIYYEYPNFDRYSHSVGVMILLKKLGASLEEQIAGLLHDVSVPAFSHVIDLVMGHTENEDWHETNHEKVFTESGVKEILIKHNFDPDKIVDFENFSLLDRPRPDLCADRVDYGLREFHTWSNPEVVPELIKQFTNQAGKILFTSKDAAKKFAINFLKLQREHWGGTGPQLIYNLLAEIIKLVMDDGEIQIDDFYHDDEHLFKRLKNSKNTKVNNILTILSSKPDYEITENPSPFYFIKKFRHVDPEFIENGTTYRLSESDPKFKEILESEKQHNTQGVYVKLKSKI